MHQTGVFSARPYCSISLKLFTSSEFLILLYWSKTLFLQNFCLPSERSYFFTVSCGYDVLAKTKSNSFSKTVQYLINLLQKLKNTKKPKILKITNARYYLLVTVIGHVIFERLLNVLLYTSSLLLLPKFSIFFYNFLLMIVVF